MRDREVVELAWVNMKQPTMLQSVQRTICGQMKGGQYLHLYVNIWCIIECAR